jgi:hypothetical protein
MILWIKQEVGSIQNLRASSIRSLTRSKGWEVIIKVVQCIDTGPTHDGVAFEREPKIVTGYGLKSTTLWSLDPEIKTNMACVCNMWNSMIAFPPRLTRARPQKAGGVARFKYAPVPKRLRGAYSHAYLL